MGRRRLRTKRLDDFAQWSMNEGGPEFESSSVPCLGSDIHPLMKEITITHACVRYYNKKPLWGREQHVEVYAHGRVTWGATSEGSNTCEDV